MKACQWLSLLPPTTRNGILPANCLENDLFQKFSSENLFLEPHWVPISLVWIFLEVNSKRNIWGRYFTYDMSSGNTSRKVRKWDGKGKEVKKDLLPDTLLLWVVEAWAQWDQNRNVSLSHFYWRRSSNTYYPKTESHCLRGIPNGC